MSVSMHKVNTMQGAKVPTEQQDEFAMQCTTLPRQPRRELRGVGSAGNR